MDQMHSSRLPAVLSGGSLLAELPKGNWAVVLAQQALKTQTAQRLRGCRASCRKVQINLYRMCCIQPFLLPSASSSRARLRTAYGSLSRTIDSSIDECGCIGAANVCKELCVPPAAVCFGVLQSVKMAVSRDRGEV
jgi:hypothetical protein